MIKIKGHSCNIFFENEKGATNMNHSFKTPKMCFVFNSLLYGWPECKNAFG